LEKISIGGISNSGVHNTLHSPKPSEKTINLFIDKSMKTKLSRDKFVQRIRAHLEHDGFPRLEMTLIVAFTGLSGFLTSVLLLHCGLLTIWLRYVCAFSVAYAVFFILLWLWLHKRSSDLIDAVDLLNVIPSPSGVSSSSLNILEAGGGNFSGAGASSSFESLASEGTTAPLSGMGDALEVAGEADEFAIPLFIIIAIGAAVLALFASSAVVIASAPVLFAELMVDAFLSASLYHRLKGLHTRHWLHTALRKTILPFLISATFFVGLGWFMQHMVPQAHSLGEVIHHYRTTP
jgi:hypothetical protein